MTYVLVTLSSLCHFLNGWHDKPTIIIEDKGICELQYGIEKTVFHASKM